MKRQGVHARTVPIQAVVDAFQAELDLTGLAAENLQARVRGVILMGLSNAKGHLALTTGNKSELATGYSTLYGDSAGGFGPIKDVPKTLVWDLARWRNTDAARRGETPPIPENSINKPPSAELSPGQLDSDSLPDYRVLDAILDDYVVKDLGVAGLVAAGHDPALVDRVVTMVDRAEYKRRQYPPGPRSPRATSAGTGGCRSRIGGGNLAGPSPAEIPAAERTKSDTALAYCSGSSACTKWRAAGTSSTRLRAATGKPRAARGWSPGRDRRRSAAGGRAGRPAGAAPVPRCRVRHDRQMVTHGALVTRRAVGPLVRLPTPPPVAPRCPGLGRRTTPVVRQGPPGPPGRPRAAAGRTSPPGATRAACAASVSPRSASIAAIGSSARGRWPQCSDRVLEDHRQGVSGMSGRVPQGQPPAEGLARHRQRSMPNACRTASQSSIRRPR